jgi:hypothetical protein
MKSLIESLHQNNVIFSYYGFIDNSVLQHVLQITKSKLENNGEPATVVKRVTDTINECIDNIISHNFYPDDSRLHYKSLIVVSKQNDHYLVDAINVVNSTQKETIHEQLSFLHSRTREELLDLKSKTMLERENPKAVSSGLVDLVLKTDDCDCSFKDLKSHHLFNINFKINSGN